MDNKIKEIIFTLLVTATEGGSNYWITLFRLDKGPEYYKTTYWQQGPIEGASYFWISDSDNVIEDDPARGEPVIYPESGTLKKVDQEALKAGWLIFKEKYPRHYADAIEEKDDATTGDVFLQCVVFGEVIYG